MSRALWHCANAFVAIGLLMFSIPFLIADLVRSAWRRVELQAVYGGDESKRDRDEWRGT